MNRNAAAGSLRGNGGLGDASFGVAAAQSTIPRKYQGRYKEQFAYTLDFLPATLSATTFGNISIQADSDFIIVAGVGVVTDTANTTFLSFVPQLYVLTDGGSGRNLTSNAIHFHNIFGTAQEPAFWPQPKVLDRGSTFTVAVQNLEATSRNVRLAFLGFKVYDMADA
jgi:hypothetical protein